MAASLLAVLACAPGTLPAQKTRAALQIEVAVRVCIVPFGSETWERIGEVDDAVPVLESAIEDGDASVIFEPRGAYREGRTGEQTFSTELPCFEWDVEKQTHKPGTISLQNRLAAKPRLLEGGTVEVHLQLQLMRVAGFTVGPHGETVPVLATQSVQATVFAQDEETVAIDGLAEVWEKPHTPLRGDVEEPRTEPVAVYLLVTPRIMDPHVLAPEPRERYQMLRCIDNIKGLCGAALLYAADAEGVLPNADWERQVDPYHGSCVPCPLVDPEFYGYVLNADVAGLALADIVDPAGIVLFFEGDADGLPPIGGAETAPSNPRHEGKIVVGYVSGNAEAVTEDRLRELLDRNPLTYGR